MESRMGMCEESAHLGQALAEAQDVQRQILVETIESAEMGQPVESGRTACGSTEDLRAPLQRFPTAVRLSECPVGRSGVWHTHPTLRGLREPVHSLPDWANVVFQVVDSSMVVGTQSSELIVASDDVAWMQDEFRNAIGLEVSSPEEVVAALRDGRISNPTAARRRVRDRFTSMVRRVPTFFPELDTRVQELAHTVDAQAPVRMSGCNHCTAHSHIAYSHKTEALHRRAKACKPLLRQTTSGINIRELTIATVIGNLVGAAVDRYLLGRD